MNLYNSKLYYIGGVVRDEFLGQKCVDIDITYVGDAIEFAKTIPNAQIVQINEPFGTVRIKLDNQEIDIASTRCESYPQKGHLPVVEKIGCSLKEDVLRRDFTINALAKSTLTGKITDYVGGLDDIKNKTIRVLHDESFIDDPTRIVRALKFAVRFDFTLAPKTKKLQEEYLRNINYDMSYKRLKKELVETFNLNSQKAFEKFINENIYKLITTKDFVLPKINFENLINKYKPENIWIIYIGLLPDISSLPLTKTEKQIVHEYQTLINLGDFCNKSDFEIYKSFEFLHLETLIMYAATDFATVEKYLDKLCNIKISLKGKDLIALGIQPSEKFQKCFDFILKEKLKNPELSKAQEINLAKKFFDII